ncbi:MAG: Lrp/AsnC family transcriptional regulator [Phycisphaerales bacterium]|nr:Lrp/AsnC family transcriptional regulator [Phycisphaerales bacterium]
MRNRNPKPEPPPEPLITDVRLRQLVAASSLTPTQRGTLLMMVDGLYRDNLKIIIGISRLADSLGLGRSATIDRIRSLESTGVIVKLRGGGGRSESGKGYVNVWEFRPEVLIQQAQHRGRVGDNSTVSQTVKDMESTDQASGLEPARVRESAHDPTLPTPPKEESNKEGAAIAAGDQEQGLRIPVRHKRTLPFQVRPWVNRADSPKMSRADRLVQMREQLKLSDKKPLARSAPNPVHSATEGETNGIIEQGQERDETHSVDERERETASDSARQNASESG